MKHKNVEKLDDLIKKLHQRFDGAIRFLKTTPISTADGRTKLFSLPWFLMLGFNQSGKTTFLSHANLDFVLSKKNHPEKHRVSHCEWWATREAVFLDVNNAYMLQSRKTRRQRKLWFNFLEQLKLYRRHQAFEGVLFCIDIEKLCSTHKNERNAYFHNIRGRLKDLSPYVRQAVPIYFIITKADKLVGFNEFFDHLTKEESRQLWGMTFGQQQIQSSQSLADAFDLEFDKLLERLNQRLIQRLHQERNLDKRAILKDFPLQIESIKKPLAAFLQNVADLTAVNQACQLRGVYFCAAQPQTDATMDRLQQPLAQTFALQTWMPSLELASHRSYFTVDIYKQLIKDRAMTLTYIKHNKARTNVYMQWGIAVACAVLVVCLVTNWVNDFSNNMAELNSIEQALAQYQMVSVGQTTVDIAQALPQLTRLAAASENAEHAKVPWAIRTFLPHDVAIYDQATLAFKQSVQAIVMKQLQQTLITQLKSSDKINASQLYNTLRAYLMLGNAKKFNQVYVMTIMNDIWGSQLDAEQSALINSYMMQAFVDINPLPLDDALINQSRTILNALPKASLAEALISASLSDAPNLSLSMPTIDGQLIFNANTQKIIIPAAFTAQEFANIYDNIAPNVANGLINGDWVTTAHPLTNQITPDAIEQVRDFYISSYIATWQSVLANLQIQPFTSYDQAIKTIASFTQANSPLMALIYQISINTNVNYRNEPTPISMAFSGFNQSTNQVLAANHDNLLQIAGYLTSVVQDKSPAAAAFELAKAHTLLAQQQNDAFYALNSQLAQLPPPYSNWFNDLAKYSWQLILHDAATVVDQAWQNSVYTEFTNNLVGFYPFNQNAKQDLTLTDFNHFFSPNGTLNNFISFYVAPFVDMTQASWQLKSFNGSSLPMSSDSLATLQQANNVAQTFFPDAGDQMNIQFLLKPLQLSPNIKQVDLSIDNQSAEYSPDFMVATRFDWPGKTDTMYIAMVLTDKDGQQANNTLTGPWSLFHWLDSLNPQVTDNQFDATYQTPPYTFAFQITDDKGTNPMVNNLLHGFTLPATL
ncbi:MAG: type VI secretion system membrane subunit TssM [Gammaproteobacteria bacterium]